MKRKKSLPKPKRSRARTIKPVGALTNPLAIEKTNVGLVAAKKWDPKALEVEFNDLMKKSFGTEHDTVQSCLLHQLTGTVPTVTALDADGVNNMDYSVATLRGIEPQDQVEGLLAVQMVAAHTMSMECMRRAAWSGQTDFGVEVNINRATRLMRVFASQVEALSRLSSGRRTR